MSLLGILACLLQWIWDSWYPLYKPHSAALDVDKDSEEDLDFSPCIGLKILLKQGISEPIFYGDLVYKFKRIVGKPNFSDQFKKIVKRYIRVGYNLDIM